MSTPNKERNALAGGTPVHTSGNETVYHNFSVGMSTIPDTMEAAIDQINSLRQQMERLQATVDTLQRRVEKSHELDRMTLSTGEEIALRPEELSAIRAVFRMFDTENKGYISPAELQALHVKLGEPISEEEARDAVHMIECDGAKGITFEEFVRYWNGTHETQTGENLSSGQAELNERLRDFASFETPIVSPSMRPCVSEVKEGTAAVPSNMLTGTAVEEESPRRTNKRSTRADSEEEGKIVAQISGDAAAYDQEEKAQAGVSVHNPAIAVPLRRGYIEQAKKRRLQWYASKFKFLKARIANPQIAAITTRSEGIFPSLEWRMSFFYDDPSKPDAEPQRISPWHDIPLRNPDETYNFICEIPKWTRRKMEIATGEQFNPIKQDVKNGMLRNYTWGDMLFNYGALPQTWEDPDHTSPYTAAGGDNDPLDVVELGSKQWRTGSIVRVKLLGVLAMIDDGETDWKVIAINIEDPIANHLHDIQDVEAHIPGALGALRRWFKYYKSPQMNEFAFGEKVQDRKYAERIVQECHEHWKKLIRERGQGALVH